MRQYVAACGLCASLVIWLVWSSIIGAICSDEGEAEEGSYGHFRL